MKKRGFLLIDKRPDWTSFDVCAVVKKHLNTRKVGHTGTLDPFATGLLVVAVGKCTKLIPYLEKAKKSYAATIKLGETTPTHDPESDVTAVDFDREKPTRDEIETLLRERFTGIQMQVPPAHSAIKIKGQRAYKLARRGDAVAIPPRETEAVVTVEHYAWPELRVSIVSRAGFYVRSLARDIGKELGVGAHCTALRRTAVGDLAVTDAEDIHAISGLIDPQHIIKTLPHREIVPARVPDFWSGRAFAYDGAEGEKYLIISGGATVGVGEICDGKLRSRLSF